MRSVAVIGAGLAGVSIAARLAREGWLVSLFDAADGLCAGASGNPAGAFHAHVSRDDAPLSRLSRAGIEATLASLQELTQRGLLRHGEDWALNGHYQLCASAEEALKTRETHRRLPHLHEQLLWCEPETIANDLGIKPHQGGLLFTRAGWVRPKAWCEALLADTDVVLYPQCRVTGVTVHASRGKAGNAGAELAYTQAGGAVLTRTFDRVVIAAAQNSLPLFNQPLVEARCVKGQVSFLKTGLALNRVVSGAAYAIQHRTDEWLIGATYERPALDTDVTEAGHTQNLEKLQAAFAELPNVSIVGGRSSIRTMWPDRLPAIGPAIDVSGQWLEPVWFATGYGSRGLSWAALAADLMGDWWAGRTPPLPQDLLAAVLPGRFFSRASNSKPTLPSLPSTK
jgi:tRNA 5-methylaminomethyl-2-thiouridine biosynthesis bifunctional protein